MLTVQDVIEELESFTPARWAFDFDNVGLLVGSTSAPVTKIITALDPSPALAEHAIKQGAELVITHHPILWNGTKSITDANDDTAFALTLAKHGISHIAAHTNWDAAPGGINDTLAGLLSLQNLSSFGTAASVPYTEIIVFCQQEQEDVLLDVMAEHGAGNIGNYRRCGFKAHGVGTFEPLPGSNPYVGRIGKSDEIEETKIEMICPTHRVSEVIAAMIERHNYEQPAFNVIPLAPLQEQPAGRIGTLTAPVTLQLLVDRINAALGTTSMAWGDPERIIEKVAVVGGAADGEWRNALEAGADVFITGEVKHHVSIQAGNAGLAIIAAGHYATENPGMRAMAEQLMLRIPTLNVSHFEPPAGRFGRPI